MKNNSDINGFGAFPRKSANRVINPFGAVLSIIMLCAACASAAGANPLIGGGASAPAPQTQASHMDAILYGFSQFIHWQMMLRILLGFGLAVGCGWFIAWHPRRSTRSNPLADHEETKTLILLGMVGAVVAEVSKLDQNMAFVIFGIGSLVRFRTVMDNPKVTGKAIMVVIIGLACGMNQWAMAAFVTGLTWLLIFWLDSHISARIKLRVTGKQDVRLIYADAQDFLRRHHCRIKAAKLFESKRNMAFVAHVPATLDVDEFEANFRLKVGEECDIEVRLY